MKRTLLVLSAIISCVVLMTACGKVKSFTANTLSGAPGGAVDNSTYPFESVSDLTGFGLSGGGFSNISISNNEVYKGTGAVLVNVVFNAPNTQGRLNKSNVSISTLSGKTVSGYVWVPYGMFSSSTPYGAFFYFQFGSGNNNDWYQSTWQNLNLPSSSSIPGVWNPVVANIGDFTLQNGDGSTGHMNGLTLSGNNVDLSSDPQVTLGFVVGQGGSSGSYSGVIYIDSINIQ